MRPARESSPQRSGLDGAKVTRGSAPTKVELIGPARSRREEVPTIRAGGAGVAGLESSGGGPAGGTSARGSRRPRGTSRRRSPKADLARIGFYGPRARGALDRMVPSAKVSKSAGRTRETALERPNDVLRENRLLDGATVRVLRGSGARTMRPRRGRIAGRHRVFGGNPLPHTVKGPIAAPAGTPRAFQRQGFAGWSLLASPSAGERARTA